MVASDEIKRFVGKKITELQNGSPSSRANLAILRRGLGKEMEEYADAWEFIYRDFPDELTGKNDNISEAERATYTTLTLFAMHQQALEQSVHNKEMKFGEAMASIISNKKENESAVTRRFNSLITSDGFSELTNHLRNMIHLIKSTDSTIGFDYEQFASDLFFFQLPNFKKNVKIRWGKQFYRNNMENDKSKESE